MCWVPKGMLCFLWSFHDGQQLHDEADVMSVCCFFRMRQLDVATWPNIQGFMTVCWDPAAPGGLKDKSQGVEGQVRQGLETPIPQSLRPPESHKRPLPSTDNSFWMQQRPSWLELSRPGNCCFLSLSLGFPPPVYTFLCSGWVWNQADWFSFKSLVT